MESFGLVLGHMLGDYVVQNDWMAKNKSNSHPGPMQIAITGTPEIVPTGDWLQKRNAWWRGHVACTVHCLCYTLAVFACSCWWMPWWGLIAVFVLHWPVDRFRLAGHWMRRVSGQKAFADGPLAPWSMIV